MKLLLITLVCVAALAGTTWHILNKPPVVSPAPRNSGKSEEVRRLEKRIEQLEAAVEKLQRETSPRVIPLSQR